MPSESDFGHLITRRNLLLAASGLSLAGLVTLPAPPASGLTVNPRSSWAKGRPPKGPLDSENVKFLIVHHSASRNGHTSADAPSILRSFYDYHTGTKGWNDIAYNFLIDSGGGIWEGRKGSLNGPVAGDATGGNQGYTQLVCLIGDFNSAQPTGKSLRALVNLLGWLADRYGIDTRPGSKVTFKSRGSNRWPKGDSVTTSTITGHRTMSQTTCPGDNLNSYVVGDLMADVEASRHGTVVTPSTSPSTTTPTTTSSSTTATTTTTSLSATTAAPTTSSPPSASTSSAETTTTFATTTSRPAPSTVLPDTSGSAVVPTSTIPGTTTSSIPLAAGDSHAETPTPILPLSLLGLAGAVGGLVFWRHRRMG